MKTNLKIACYLASDSFLLIINNYYWPENVISWAGRESYWSNFYFLVSNFFLIDPLPHVYKITICSLCTDIDIPVLKYLARYTYLNSISDWITTTHSSVIGPFQKKSKQQGGLRTWNFEGYWMKKEHVEITGFKWKRSGISRGDKKLMWNFHGYWFLDGTGISKGCSKSLQNFQGQSFVSSRISKGKVTNLKSLGIFLKKVRPHSTSPAWIFFWNSPLLDWFGFGWDLQTLTFF